MAAKLKRQAFISAILFAAAAAMVGPGTAQDETNGETGSSVESTKPARDRIVTDPDLRRLEERRRRVGVLSGLFDRQTRVFRISYRLLYAAVDMCPANARPAVGFTYANAYMFQGAVRTAATAMGYTHRVSVVELAPNSSAARAGVRPRDELLAIDDWPVPYGEGAVTLTQAKLRDVLVRDNRTTLTLRRGAGDFTVVIEPDYICDMQVLAVPGDPIRAYANGDKVVIFEGLHSAVEDDDVLAAAIAREIANNLIPDLDIDTEVGVDWSSFFDWGLEPEASGDLLADQSLAQDYGNAADYVGAYLMARAGFDHHKAPDLWYQMANRDPLPPQHSYGTPQPEYLLGLEQTVAEIDRKLAAKAPLRPEQSGPPTELAAAPEPTGAIIPTPDAAPVPAAVAGAETVAEDRAVGKSAVLEPGVPVADLPWMEAAPVDAAEPLAAAGDPGEAAPAAPTELADLPWVSKSTESASDTAAPAAPSPDTGNPVIPRSEVPSTAMAALGLVPSEPITDEPDAAAAQIADTLAAAPAPTEPLRPIPDTTPERVTIAEAEPVEEDGIVEDSAASEPAVSVADLPWKEPAPTGAVEPLPVVPDPSAAAQSVGTEVSGLPWTGESPDAITETGTPAADEAQIAEIVVSDLEIVSPQTPTVGAEPPIVMDQAPAAPIAGTGTPLVPNSEAPHAAIAALGPVPSSDPIADAPETVPASVSEAPVVAPPQPVLRNRKILAPATGEAEIAVLFRNQPAPNPVSATPESLAPEPEPPALTDGPQVAAVPIPDAVTPLPPEETAQSGDDDFDIGDLIRQLESEENAAADKLATPDETRPQSADRPWLTESPDPPEVTIDRGVAIAAAPPVVVDRAILVAPSPELAVAHAEPSANEAPVGAQSSVRASLVPDQMPSPVDDLPKLTALPATETATPDESDSAPSAEKTVILVEPRANSMPMVASRSVQASLVPDQLPTPVDDLPALAALPVPAIASPDEKIDSAEETVADEAAIESELELIAPSAGPSAGSADPAELGKGFSFRTWLGEG